MHRAGFAVTFACSVLLSPRLPMPHFSARLLLGLAAGLLTAACQNATDHDAAHTAAARPKRHVMS